EGLVRWPRPHPGGDLGALALGPVAERDDRDDADDQRAAGGYQCDCGVVRRRDHPGATQKGPSSGWSVVFVPRGGPSLIVDVSTITFPSTIDIWNRSRPRGAGPSLYSPALLYFEPWQGHSNHFDELQNGTRHPRWTQR